MSDGHDQVAAPPADLWTVQKVLHWSRDYLKKVGSPTAQLDAEVLLASALQCNRISLYTGLERPLDLTERERYRGFVSRRAAGEPVAYITGRKGFWRHEFIVNKTVLIPRPETETLIETCLALTRHFNLQPTRMLEIGTGSGCVAVALASEFPNATIDAWDSQRPALIVAEENIVAAGFSDRIKLACVDVLRTDSVQDGYDFIVSNPPYIGEYERERLDKSVVAFEPESALFADDAGLAFYRHFAKTCGSWLKPGGMLVVEVGHNQADAVAQLLREQGDWENVQTIHDLAGIVRVVSAKTKG